MLPSTSNVIIIIKKIQLKPNEENLNSHVTVAVVFLEPKSIARAILVFTKCKTSACTRAYILSYISTSLNVIILL